MKILRFTYPPSGRFSLEELPSGNYRSKKHAGTPEKVRIEIFNIHGEFVYIFNDREKVRNLKLPEGFYLVKEKNSKGDIINTEKLVF